MWSTHAHKSRQQASRAGTLILSCSDFAAASCCCCCCWGTGEDRPSPPRPRFLQAAPSEPDGTDGRSRLPCGLTVLRCRMCWAAALGRPHDRPGTGTTRWTRAVWPAHRQSRPAATTGPMMRPQGTCHAAAPCRCPALGLALPRQHHPRVAGHCGLGSRAWPAGAAKSSVRQPGGGDTRQRAATPNPNPNRA